MGRHKNSWNKKTQAKLHPESISIEESAQTETPKPESTKLESIHHAQEFEKTMSLARQVTYKTVMIPAKNLVIDKFNMRPEDKIDFDFKQNLKDNGLLEDLLVRPLGNDKYGIICGGRRFTNGELKEFPCRIQEMSDLEAMFNSMSGNLQKEPSSLEWANITIKLRNEIKKLEPKITSDTDALMIISKRLHIAFSTLQGYVAFIEHSTPETVNAVQQGKIPFKKGQEIARKPPEQQPEAVEEAETNAELPTKDGVKKRNRQQEKAIEAEQNKAKLKNEIKVEFTLDENMYNLLRKLGQDGNFASTSETARILFLEGVKSKHLEELKKTCLSCSNYPCKQLQRIGLLPEQKPKPQPKPEPEPQVAKRTGRLTHKHKRSKP